MSQMFCIVGVGLIFGTLIMIVMRLGDNSAGQVIKLLAAAVVVGGIFIWFSLNGGLPGPPARENIGALKLILGITGSMLLLGGIVAFFTSAAVGGREPGKVGCIGVVVCFAIGGLFLWLAFG